MTPHLVLSEPWLALSTVAFFAVICASMWAVIRAGADQVSRPL